MAKGGIACENIVHCPKCGWILRQKDGYVDPHKNLGIVGKDMYCEKCDDVMMTIFD